MTKPQSTWGLDSKFAVGCRTHAGRRMPATQQCLHYVPKGAASDSGAGLGVRGLTLLGTEAVVWPGLQCWGCRPASSLEALTRGFAAA